MMAEHQERPNFNQQPAHHIVHHHKQGSKDDPNGGDDGPEMYTEMPHQIEEHQHMFNDEEPSKMFTFEEGQQPLI